MIFKGCIDNVSIIGTNLVVGGWCYIDRNGKLEPIENYFIRGFFPIQNISLNTVFLERIDLKHILNGKIGFRIALPEVVSVESFDQGEYHLYAKYGAEEYPIKIWSELRLKLRDFVVLDSIKRLSVDLQVKKDNLPIKQDAYTNLTVSVGTLAYGSDAIIGHEGMAFLIGGTNNVQQQYSRFDQEKCNQWKNIFINRNIYFTKRGCKYLQMIIPEKQSVYPELMPFEIASPSPLYSALSSFLERELGSGSYVDAYGILNNKKVEDRVFKDLDTHLSFFGTMSLFCALLDILKLPHPPLPPVYKSDTVIGDLSDRFAPFPIYSKQNVPDLEQWQWSWNVPELIYSNVTPPDRHVGMIKHWINKHALCDNVVMVFGNSFFERGISSHGLTWWFIRYFKTVYFIWKSEIDTDLIEKYNPDIVVCQTIERFLTMVPKQ